MFDFHGRVAFVTGGASGIGLGIAQALAKRGCRLALADIDEAQLDKVVGEFPGEAVPVRLDVRDRAAWAAAKQSVEDRLGPVSVLINNAGIMDNPIVPLDQRGLVDYSPDAWDRMIDISLTGMANGVMTFGRSLRERRDELAPFDVGVSVLIPGVTASRLAINAAKQIGLEVSEEMRMPGLDPAVTGEFVADGIKHNLLYILTHGEYRRFCEDRFARISAAFTEVPPSPGYNPAKPLAGTREWANDPNAWNREDVQ